MTARAFSVTEDERLRVERVDELVALGASGVGELLENLSDTSWTVRRTVVAALASLGDDAVAPLVAWLVGVRATEHGIAAAVDALSASTGSTVTPSMIGLLAHPSSPVVVDAAQVLGRRRAVEAAPMLVTALGHADDNVAVAAIEALGAIGTEVATDALIGVLASRNFFRTFPALQVLSHSSDPRVVSPIADLLADELYRVDAARALGKTGHPHAVERLAGVLSEPRDAERVRVVAQALFDLVERSRWTGSMERVVAAIRRELAPWRGAFAHAVATADRGTCKPLTSVLGWIGDASVLPVLGRLLEDPDVHDCAVESIQRLVRADTEILLVALASEDPGLRATVLPVTSTARASARVRQLLGDPDPEIRARACEATGRIGDPAAVTALFEMLADVNPRVAHAATAAIHSLGSDRTPELTIEALREGSPAVRRQALRIVAYLGIDEALEPVRAAIADPDLRLAELAIGALGKLSVADVEPLLTRFASDPREPIRAAVMRVAAQRETPTAQALLERGLTDEAPWVRYYACQGLGRFGHASVTNLVIARLADAAAQVRIAALEALGQLDGEAAWQALFSAARSSDDDARRAALASLALRPNAGAIALLLDAARTGDVPTRLVALSGLADVMEEPALAALAAATRDPDPQICEAAVSLLADRSDPDAAHVLVDLALESPPAHPVHAVLSRPSPARVEAIESRFAAANDIDAVTLVAALARMHDDRATHALYRALTVANPAVRRAAAGVVGAAGVKRAHELLTRLAVEDSDPEVRRVCRAAVGA